MDLCDCHCLFESTAFLFGEQRFFLATKSRPTGGKARLLENNDQARFLILKSGENGASVRIPLKPATHGSAATRGK